MQRREKRNKAKIEQSTLGESMGKSSYDKEAPQTIQEMFGTIAKRYDRANALLSLNMHRYWNRRLVDVALKATPGRDFLDLCSGTGDIAFAIGKKSEQPAKVTLLDFCKEMLEEAKKKEPRGVSAYSYIEGDATDLPFDSDSFDCITLSYGIRNVKVPERCIAEAMRVLRDEGVLAILELTRPSHPILRLGHECYLKGLLPLMGRAVTDNEEAYKYLSSSINHFISPEELAKSMEREGFRSITVTPLTGGIATLITAIV